MKNGCRQEAHISRKFQISDKTYTRRAPRVCIVFVTELLYVRFNDGEHSKQTTEYWISAVLKCDTFLLRSPPSILPKSPLLSTFGVGTAAVVPTPPVIAVMIEITYLSAVDILPSVFQYGQFLP